MNAKISNFSQVASLRRYTMTEGREQGLDVIDCDNGNLRFLLNVSKACDVMQLYHKGQNVSFVSKNGFTKRETPFLQRFEGGMLYTCGLDSVGGRDGYELHGSFHNTPAQILRAECDENGITVEALIRNTALFGQNLVMKRTVTAAIGGDSITVQDTLVNEGFCDAAYCLLYHINVGYPMLDEGAKIEADVQKCVPRTPWSQQNEDKAFSVIAPQAVTEETCYFLTLGAPKAALVNEKLGKKLTVTYSGETLPHFVEWNSAVSGDYAVGLEPATTELDDRFAYCTLGPGASVDFCINIAVNELPV